MAASLATGSALLQPTKFSVTRSSSKLSSLSSHVSRAFGFEPATSAQVSCSLQSDVKEFTEKCASATKIAAFTLDAVALVASGASAEGPPKRLTYDEIQSQTYLEVKGSGTANQCLTIDSGVESFPFKAGKYVMRKLCMEPTFLA